MISASLLGALAGSGALPFPRESYEQTICGVGPRRQGQPRRVCRRLRARAAAMPRAHAGGRHRPSRQPTPAGAAGVDGPDGLLRRMAARCRRASTPIPNRVRDMASRGLKKVVDYQDLAYGAEYLDRLDQAVALDDAGAWLHAVDRRGEASRQRHVLRRHDPRRRSEDALDARRPRAPRGRRQGRRHPAGDRIFPPAHRGVLRHDAGRARPLHRGAAEARRLPRPPHQSRPAHPHRQLCRLRQPLADRRHAPLAPPPAAPPGRGRASRALVPAGARIMSRPTMRWPSRSSTAAG